MRVQRCVHITPFISCIQNQKCEAYTPIKGELVEGVLVDSALLARAAADIASDKKASDVILLDVRDVTTIADYFVVCSGNNSRQLQAIAEAIDEGLGQQGGRLLHREGNAENGWVLLDFGDIIVHIFAPKEREYYRLERLWNEAKTVVYLQ
jgi:ribosome-associated protein